MFKLSEKEIRKRLERLHNYENKKHPELKNRNDRLREENKDLKSENTLLKKALEKIALELEELQAMKFGKKRSNSKVKASPLAGKEQAEKTKRKKAKRSPESYRRAEPAEEEITDHLRLELEVCPQCGEPLVDKKEHTHYREDLVEAAKLIESARKIVETTVESGQCRNPKCEKYGKKQFAMEVPKQKVIIGENIRRMVVYMIIVQGQSHEEVRKGLLHQYGITISDGEVTNILKGESVLLTPYYNHLATILGPSHYDETTWNTLSQGSEISEGNYCWVRISIATQNRIILFGRSRGKGVAEELRGKREGSVGVSDDYGSYKNLFEHHGLCWAHPHRKLRDLSESGKLKGKRQQVCKKAFTDFSKVYKRGEKIRQKLLEGVWNEEKKKEEREKLENLFDIPCKPNDYDPEKLKTLRETLGKRKSCYFTFFDFPEMPLDNNKAERAIRKIVIKRKKSFGCKSAEGANILSVLYSVIFSLMESNTDKSFFELYDQAADFEQENKI